MRRAFDPATSILAGMDEGVLRTRLAQLQDIYLKLLSGGQGKSFTYTQGDGTKSVTYTEANIGDLMMAIRQIQAQLGIIDTPRRGIGVKF